MVGTFDQNNYAKYKLGTFNSRLSVFMQEIKKIQKVVSLSLAPWPSVSEKEFQKFWVHVKINS